MICQLASRYNQLLKMHGLEKINTKELRIFTCIENTRNGWNRIEELKSMYDVLLHAFMHCMVTSLQGGVCTICVLF